MTLELVGRDAELRRIEEFAGSLTSGGAALLISGGAGIGKTALWRAGAEQASAASIRVLQTRCSEVEMPIALGALSDLIGELLTEVATELPPAQRTALEVALGVEESGELRPDRLALARATLATLERAARSSPLLVAIDDAQWLDPASRRVLAFALRRTGESHIGLLATARTGSESPDSLALGDAYPPGRYVEIPLGPMSPGALQHVLRTRLGAHLPRPTLARVHTASGGNPMFAVEFARLELSARTAEHPGPLSIPTSLDELVTARIAALPAELLPLLRVASALERPTLPVLAAALGDAERADALVAAAVRAEALAGSDAGIRFAHPLLAAAVYFGIPPRERRELHARLATLVPDIEERGRHAALAADEPDTETAKLVDAAASAAGRRGALDAAATLAAEAARVTPDENERRERELEAAGYLIDTGEFAAARPRLDPLLSDDIPTRVRARALVLRAECEIANRHLLIDLLREASTVSDDPRLRWQALIRLAQHGAWITGDALGAVATAREALAIALDLGDPTLVEESEAVLAYYESACGLSPDAPAARAARPPAPQLHAPWWQFGSGLSLGTRLMWAGAVDSARAELLAEHAVLSEAGREARAGFVLITLAGLEWRAGRWDRAEEVSGEATAILGDLILTAYPRLLLDASRGRDEEARALAREMLGWAENLADHFHPPLIGHALGLLELSQGNLAGAVAVCAPAAAQLAAAGIANPGYIPILPDLVEALVGVARPDEAADVSARLEAAAARVATPYAHCLAGRARALVLLARGDGAAAAAVAEEAADGFATLGVPLDQARARLTAGDAYRRLGERRRAAEAIESAAKIFEELAAPLWLERAEQELRRASPRTKRDRDRDALTAAEERVAVLVAAGRTNKEVAAELFTSVATVEAHLTRIYRKLGIRSRSELTRRVADGSMQFHGTSK